MDLHFLTFNVIFPCLFLLTHAVAGSQLLALFKLSTHNLAFEAVTGFLFSIVIIELTKFVQPNILTTEGLIFIIYLIFFIFKLIKMPLKNHLKNILQILVIVSILSFTIYFISKGSQLALLGNNDIFNWYTVASHMAGLGSYFNIAPMALNSFESANLSLDGLGTDYFLLFASLGRREIILSNQTSLVILLTLITLIVISQVQLFFLNTKYFLLEIFSCFFTLTPLLVYIAFNGFFAHLMGTIAGGLLIWVAIYLTINQIDFYRSTILFFIPLGLLLISYQSGFFVFFGIMIGFIFSHALLNIGEEVKFKEKKIRKMIFFNQLFSLTLAVLMASLLYWDSAIYMIHRTLFVSKIVAGWPLDPWMPIKLNDVHSKIWITVITYSSSTLIVLICFIVYLKKKLPKNLYQIYLATIIWFIALTFIYFIWYAIGISPYQNWKFASFYIYSLGFVFIVPSVILINDLFDNGSLKFKILTLRKVFIIIINIIVLSFSFIYLIKTRERITILDQKVEELIYLRDKIDKNLPIILDLPPYGDSMLPMQLFSSFKLYPLSDTYISKTSQMELLPLKNKLFLRYRDPNCYYNDHDSILLTTKHYELSSYKNSILKFGLLPVNYQFSYTCMPQWLTFGEGISDREDWGRWSDGYKTTFILKLEKLKQVNLDFIVFPYLPPGIDEQIVEIKVGGAIIGKFKIKEKKILSFTISNEINIDGNLLVEFTYENPKSPKDFGGSDVRNLSLGFISISVRP